MQIDQPGSIAREIRDIKLPTGRLFPEDAPGGRQDVASKRSVRDMGGY